MNKYALFKYFKKEYPLLKEEKLKDVISRIPKEIIMGDHYITGKEFRKLNMVTEVLTEKFNRKSIKWYCEDDGWSLLIDDDGSMICVRLSGVDIAQKNVMDILKMIIGNL